MVGEVLSRLGEEDYPTDINEIRDHVFDVHNYLEGLISDEAAGEAPQTEQLQKLFDDFVPIAYQLGYPYEGSVIRDYLFKLLNPEEVQEYVRVFEDQISKGEVDDIVTTLRNRFGSDQMVGSFDHRLKTVYECYAIDCGKSADYTHDIPTQIHYQPRSK